MLLKELNTLELVADHLEHQLTKLKHQNYYVIGNLLVYQNQNATFYWNFEQKKDGIYSINQLNDDVYLYHINTLFIVITSSTINIQVQ